MDEFQLNDLLLSLKESPEAKFRWMMIKVCENNEIKEWLIKNTEVVPTEFV